MMKKLILAPLVIAASLGVAACGGKSEEEQALFNACVENSGETEQYCNCFVNEAQDELSPEAFDMLANQAAGQMPEFEDAESAQALATELMTFVSEAEEICSQYQ